MANCDLIKTRASLTEQALFGDGPLEGWCSMFPEIRKDLTFVMDDSWDISIGESARKSLEENSLYGSLHLAEDRFPSCTGHPKDRLSQLKELVCAQGWRSLGGWVCAQEAPGLPPTNRRSYWIERLRWMKESGFSYWKVDWGKECKHLEWRRLLTDLGTVYAPDLVIEHAMIPEAVCFSNAFRTYDVENINAIAPTIQRVVDLLGFTANPGPFGIINCEDEPYIAAGLGCAIGVMRHGFKGPFPDGRMDTCFPPIGRHIKDRLDEVIRGVRWHRICGPIPVANDAIIGQELGTDVWEVHAGETWNKREPGSFYRESAPLRVSRGMPLCTVRVEDDTPQPFVLASRAPNGATAIAALGRTLGRTYTKAGADVTAQVGRPGLPIGIFGAYRSLTLIHDQAPEGCRVLAQDLCADEAVDITKSIRQSGHALTLDGDLIDRIGRAGGRPGDVSEAGMVLQLLPSDC